MKEYFSCEKVILCSCAASCPLSDAAPRPGCLQHDRSHRLLHQRYRIAGGGLYQRFYPSGINLSLAGFYTQRNQVNVFYNGSFFTPDSPWWIQYGGSGRYYPESFYGTGPDTRLDDEERYTNVGVNQYLRLYYRFGESLYAGPVLRYRFVDIVDPDSGGLIETGMVDGTEGYQLVAAGAGFGTGRLPLTPLPLLGLSYEASLVYTGTVGGDRGTGLLTESDLRLYYDLGKRFKVRGEHQLAVQQVTRIAGGNHPFAELPSIGGANQMRGYAADRFRDAASVLVQGDYRFPIFRKLKGALFGGIGNVGEDISAALTTGGLKVAAGAGLRYQMGPTPDTSFRLDFAFTPEGFGVYFTFGEAF